jgi:hypothetical protein
MYAWKEWPKTPLTLSEGIELIVRPGLSIEVLYHQTRLGG